MSDGTVVVRGDPGARVGLAEIARAAEPGRRYLEPGEPAGLSARRRFEVSHMTYPYGAHAAVVAVDPGTGQVRVLRYLVAYEVGRAVNPMLVEGQLRGGVAQGIGGALFEEFGYDEAGQPQAISFIEYRMPTAAEVPPVDLLVSPGRPVAGQPAGRDGRGRGRRQRGRRRGGQRGPGRARPVRRRRPAAADSGPGPRAMGGPR